MNSNFETMKYADARAKVQAELDARPRIKDLSLAFVKTQKEKEEIKNAKSSYKSEMYRLFGEHWKVLSRILGCLNVPSDPIKRQKVQKDAEKKLTFLFK